MTGSTLSRIRDSAFGGDTKTYRATVGKGYQFSDPSAVLALSEQSGDPGGAAFLLPLYLHDMDRTVTVGLAAVDSSELSEGQEVTLFEINNRVCWIPATSYKLRRRSDGKVIDVDSVVW